MINIKDINIRRIVLGLVSAVAVSGLVFGATQAFFSDTETSTGNRFQAGKIDLKIDHAKASYNGRECGTCEVVGPNLVVNGSFEEPAVSNVSPFWNAYPHNAVPGWSAEWVNVVDGTPEIARIELHRGVSNPAWLAKDGVQYSELDSDWDGPSGNINNEQALIKLSQSIPTVNGKKYELTYWHSYRPERDASENQMFVYWDGTEINHINDANGTGQNQTSWKKYTHEVEGNGSPIVLMFTGAGPNNSFGIFLDDVVLREKTCDIENGQCKLWEEKDLTDNDFFWNFNDVKPGDYGRNVISYRVYDNDAWMCTLLGKEDVENVIIEPEAEAGDVTDPLGELSQFLSFFVWRDIDGDGLYEPLSGESMIIDNTLNNISSWPIAEPAGLPVPASTTGYIGVAWCFGSQTPNDDGTFSCSGFGNHNIAQTDVVNMVVEFYAEQSRNNPNFTCAGLPIPSPVALPQ